MVRKRKPVRTQARWATNQANPSGPADKARILGLVSEYSIYAIAAFIPLVVISYRDFILYETPKVALLNILSLVALLSWSTGMFRAGSFQLRRPPFLVPVLAYFGVYTLATGFSISPVLSIFGIVDRSIGLIIMGNLVVLYFLAFNVLNTRERQLRLLKVFVLGASVVAILGILQNLGIDSPYLPPGLEGQRVGSTLGNPDYGTPVMVLALPADARLKIERFQDSPAPQGGDSRLQIGRLEDSPPPKVAAGPGAVLVNLVSERIELRKGLWEAGIKSIREHPFLGTGPNTYRDVFTLYEPLYYVRMLPDFREDKAHNEYIEVAQSTGLIGLAVYLWMMSAVLFFFASWVWKNLRRKDTVYVAAIAVGATGYLAYIFFVFHTIAAHTVFWLLLAAGAGLCRPAQNVIPAKAGIQAGAACRVPTGQGRSTPNVIQSPAGRRIFRPWWRWAARGAASCPWPPVRPERPFAAAQGDSRRASAGVWLCRSAHNVIPAKAGIQAGAACRAPTGQGRSTPNVIQSPAGRRIFRPWWRWAARGADSCSWPPTHPERPFAAALGDSRRGSLYPYMGIVSLIILGGAGFLALRPVLADLAESNARVIEVKDEESATLEAEWYRKAADWHPYEYAHLRGAAHALSDLGAKLNKPVTDPLFQEAFYYIGRAQEQEPLNATVYFNKAVIYQRAGKSSEDILKELDSAVELYPYYIDAYNMMGDVYGDRQEYEKAVAARQKALGIMPGDASIMVEMGYNYLQSRKFPHGRIQDSLWRVIR